MISARAKTPVLAAVRLQVPQRFRNSPPPLTLIPSCPSIRRIDPQRRHGSRSRRRQACSSTPQETSKRSRPLLLRAKSPNSCDDPSSPVAHGSPACRGRGPLRTPAVRPLPGRSVIKNSPTAAAATLSAAIFSAAIIRVIAKESDHNLVIPPAGGRPLLDIEVGRS